MQESHVGHQTRLSFYLVLICTTVLLVLMWGLTPESTASVVWSSVALCGCLIFSWSFIGQTRARLSFFSFLLSCVAFSLAYWQHIVHPIQWWLPITLIAIGIVLYLLFLPYIDTRMTVVAVLGIGLLGLIWSASEWWLQVRSWDSWEAFVGAALWFTVFFRVMVYPGQKKQGEVSFLTTAGFLLALCLLVVSLLPYHS
ncbi:lysoplasmalogenase family protein [Vibrio mangrovi]|uniref:Lysoplasmalogenase family protein n=1 Tax=Vibrio mangrovi TaxID=474394 RepID=A0A1Y6IW38_9VIBR|nr:lysoplasmalogenase family protein [Vibrio mangrovi]MDW6002595.1 lysoplasmalogenase family protein [Vibrio mangrovi]SMS01874.1 YhhN-like protein [Vibrio mangrovi]